MSSAFSIFWLVLPFAVYMKEETDDQLNKKGLAEKTATDVLRFSDE